MSNVYPYRNKFTLTSNLKSILKQRGLSLRELERQTGESYESLRRIYNNTNSQVTLPLVANVCLTLNISLSDLYTITPRM